MYSLSRLGGCGDRKCCPASKQSTPSAATCPPMPTIAADPLRRRISGGAPSTACDFYRRSANGQAQPIQAKFSILADPPMFRRNQVRRDMSHLLDDRLSLG